MGSVRGLTGMRLETLDAPIEHTVTEHAVVHLHLSLLEQALESRTCSGPFLGLLEPLFQSFPSSDFCLEY